MRVLHAADLHLDSPFRGLSAEKARRRRQESRELLRRLAGLARERQAELVLLSGDLFDGAQVYRDTLEELAEALASLPCPVFIAPGNHDPYCSGSPYQTLRWPENVHIFTPGPMQAVEVGACTVYGAAFAGPEQPESPLAGFTAPGDGRLHIGCLHGDTGLGPYGPIRREEIARSGLHYLALGHIHQCSGLLRQGDVCYAYPGCPEGRGFDETGEKGVLFGTVERQETALALVPLCRRRYEIVEADVTGRTPREALDAALTDGYREDILRVLLTGEAGEVPPDLDALAAAFGHRCFHLTLRDHTRPGEALWSRAGEDSLRGLFLRELLRRYEAAAGEEERQSAAAAARLGLAAMDGRDL